MRWVERGCKCGEFEFNGSGYVRKELRPSRGRSCYWGKCHGDRGSVKGIDWCDKKKSVSRKLCEGGMAGKMIAVWA